MKINTRIFAMFRSKLLPVAVTSGASVEGVPMMPGVDGDGNVWVRQVGVTAGGVPETLVSGGDDLDGVAPVATGRQFTDSRNYGFNGAAWDRIRTASAAVLAAFSSLGAMLISKPGSWAINHTPAAATQATITRGAGAAGVRHVCTGISFGFNAVAAEAGTFLINLRDGATGAGTILQSWRVGPFAVGASMIHSISDLNIPGTAATAMTIEFAAAGAAGNFEFVDLHGYDAA